MVAMLHRIHCRFSYSGLELFQALGRQIERTDSSGNLLHCQALVATFAGQCKFGECSPIVPVVAIRFICPACRSASHFSYSIALRPLQCYHGNVIFLFPVRSSKRCQVV